MRCVINSNLIQERMKCLNSTIEEPDAQTYYESALHSNDKTGQKLLKFVEHCADPHNANKYTRNCIYFLEKANVVNESVARKITNTFVNQVLPYVKDTNDVTFLASRYQLSEAQESAINEQVEKLNSADRIVYNHGLINRRFNTEKWFHRGSTGAYLESNIDKYCQNMDTYDCHSDQKMALYLEHLFYILQKENIPHDPSVVTEQVVNYFLYRDLEISENTYQKYQQVLEDCPMIDDKTLSSVSYFKNGFDSEKDLFKRSLKQFDVNPTKSDEGFEDMVQTIMSSKNTTSIADDFGDLLRCIWKLVEYSAMSMETILNVCKSIVAKIQNRAIDKEFTREDISIIDTKIDEMIKHIDITCYDMDDLPESSDRLFELKDMLKDMKEELSELFSVLMTSKNLKEIEALDQCTESMMLSEFKFFKFNNIINTCMKIDKCIKAKRDKFLKKASKKLKEIKSSILETDIDLDRCISDDSKFDYCMNMYEITDDNDLSDIIEAAENLCSEVRKDIVMPKGLHLYYKVSNMLEFHIGYEKLLTLSESQKESISEKLSYPDLIRAVTIHHESEVMDTFSNIRDLLEDSHDRFPSAEETALIIELSQYIPDQTIGTVRSLAASYEDNTQVKKALSEWSPIDAPYEIVSEASGMVYALMESDQDKKKVNEEKNRKKEEANKKPSIAERIKNSAIKKKDEKEDPEKKFKGLHLNDIKLYIAALRKKMKDMSSKEKEMSRNLDTYMGMMQKSIKDALISDRRESIIKGSVIPSFSKAMKICIGLAGVTIIAPPIGIIAAVGGLAMSKNLTKKERMLLLDELEVEMEVIDKEIELAQNRNQIKRYRQLLQYKKKCQREYQRIKYNIKARHDVPFSSSLGVKSDYSD